MSEIFTPISPSEDAKVFSKERAKRGAKTGAMLGGALIAGGLVLGAISEPGQMAEGLVLHTSEIAEVTGLCVAYSASIGAVIDGFKPTSRLFSRYIIDHVENFRSMKRGFDHLRHDINYGELLGNILRPPLPDYMLESKKRFLSFTTLAGTGGGVAIWGSAMINRALDKVFGMNDPSHLTQLIDAVANHPVETIGIGAAIGFGAASYALMFHRSSGNGMDYLNRY